jgi:hypothetical protein
MPYLGIATLIAPARYFISPRERHFAHHTTFQTARDIDMVGRLMKSERMWLCHVVRSVVHVLDFVFDASADVASGLNALTNSSDA